MLKILIFIAFISAVQIVDGIKKLFMFNKEY